MKKIIFVFLLIFCLYTPVFAMEECVSGNSIMSGKCGDNMEWIISDGILTIYGTGKMYDSTDPWKEYKDKITKIIIQDGVESIGKGAFDCMKVETVEIADSVKIIGNNAFWGTEGIINIPSNLTYIGNFAFTCSSKTLPNNLNISNCEYIGTSAFSDHNEIQNIIFSNTLTSINDSSFEGCSGLTEVHLPDSLVYLGQDCFAKCYNLKTIYIPRTLICIDWGALDESIIENIYYSGCEKRWNEISGNLFYIYKNVKINYALEEDEDILDLGEITIAKGQSIRAGDYFDYISDCEEYINMDIYHRKIKKYTVPHYREILIYCSQPKAVKRYGSTGIKGKKETKIIVYVYKETYTFCQFSVNIVEKPKFQIKNKIWNKDTTYKINNFIKSGSLDPIYQYESSNPDVIEINEKTGNFKVNSVGKAKITIYIGKKDYWGTKKIKQNIKVKELNSTPKGVDFFMN